MEIWRQFIVLQDKKNKQAKGHVKLMFAKEDCEIKAVLSIEEKECYVMLFAEEESYVWKGSGPDNAWRAKMRPGRIEGAVVTLKGEVLAAGVSTPPALQWERLQIKVQNELQQKTLRAARGAEASISPRAEQQPGVKAEKEEIAWEILKKGETAQEKQKSAPPLQKERLMPVEERKGEKPYAVITNREVEIQGEAQGPALGGVYADLWSWKRVEDGQTGSYYLLGSVERKGSTVAMAIAVPGAYAPQPPAHLQGFSIYRDGYWVLAQDSQTGRTLAV